MMSPYGHSKHDDSVQRVQARRLAPFPGNVDLQALLAGSLDERMRKFRKELSRCKRRFSEGAVHDLRVSIRRLISMLDILLTVLPDDGLRKCRKMLKKHLRAFGPLRDVQVQIVQVAEMVSAYPELAPFLTVLRLREQRYIRKLGKQVQKIRVSALVQGMAEGRKRVRTPFKNTVTEGAVRAAIIGAAAAGFVRSVNPSADVSRSNASSIHKLRVSFKEFRYMVEVLQPILIGVTDGQLKAMHDYQQRMGDIQDLEVLTRSVSEFGIGRRRMVKDASSGIQQELVRRKEVLMDAFVSSADELLQFWKDESPPVTFNN